MHDDQRQALIAVENRGAATGDGGAQDASLKSEAQLNFANHAGNTAILLN